MVKLSCDLKFFDNVLYSASITKTEKASCDLKFFDNVLY